MRTGRPHYGVSLVDPLIPMGTPDPYSPPK